MLIPRTGISKGGDGKDKPWQQSFRVTAKPAGVCGAVREELPVLFVSGINIRPFIYQQLAYCWPAHLSSQNQGCPSILSNQKNRTTLRQQISQSIKDRILALRGEYKLTYYILGIHCGPMVTKQLYARGTVCHGFEEQRKVINGEHLVLRPMVLCYVHVRPKFFHF